MKDLKKQIDEKESLKVLYVTHYGDLYGANRSMLNMILELREKWNVNPHVLLNDKTGDLVRELEKNNINYTIARYYNCTIDIRKGKVRFKRWRKRVLRFFSYNFMIRKLKRHKFEIVHSNSSVVDLGYYASKKLRCHHIWHIREYGLEDYNLVQIDNDRKVRKRYITTDWVIAVSQSIREMISGIDTGINVKVIYNGIKIPEKYEKEYCRNGKVHFCIVGVVSKNKNQMEVVKAINYLVHKGYQNFCLHIVGGDFENEISAIQQFVNSNGISDYVDFTGYMDKVETFLKTMDVGIVASHKEAFGRVTVEYMSNYMPVIGANTGGTSELIEEGENGFLYSLGDVKGLAKKMEFFLNNTSMIGNMGVSARKSSEKYTVSNNAYQVRKIYNQVCVKK